MVTLQEWEGHVVQIDASEFVARLVDLTAGHSHESQEAVIPLANLSERFACRMAIGSIFHWRIGYERSPKGTLKPVSRISFRDVAKMTNIDFLDGREWARKIALALNP